MKIEKLIEQLQKSADFEDYPVVASFAAIIEKKYLREAATALERLQAENDRLKRERDSAVEEIPKVCYYCKHRKGWKTCDRFNGNSEAETCTNWQWRGPKEE